MGTIFRKDVSWMAFLSLLLGVMTFMMIPFFYFTVFPAIILAHIAIWRASKSEEPVEGKAIAIVGLVLNYGFLLTFVLLPIFLSYRDDFDKRSFGQRLEWVRSGFHSQPMGRQMDCSGNLKVVGRALLEYANENGGYFPSDLEALLDDELIKDPRIFSCPDRRFYQPGGAESFSTDYIYLGHGQRNDHQNASYAILMYDQPENHRGDSLNILFIDGHVGRYKEDSIEKICRKFNLIMPEPQ